MSGHGGSPTGDHGRIEVSVHGTVQGVGFRWFVYRLALRLDLRGWVANRPGGAVELVAEGPEGALESLLAGLRAGPPGSHVSRVDVRRDAPTGRFSSFEIRPGSHPGD